MNPSLFGSHYTGSMWQPPTPWGEKLAQQDADTSDDLNRQLGLGRYRKSPKDRPQCLCGCLREVPATMRSGFATTQCRRRVMVQKQRKAGSIKNGEAFGSWTVIAEAPIRAANGGRQYRVRCECGSTGVVLGTHLNRGDSTQCRKCALEVAQERGRAVLQQRAG